MTYKLLDLFCGAGGAARGYQMAGFHVTGIDNRPMPRYAGDVFIQADALEYVAEHGHEYDAIHASPPCQKYSTMTKGRWKGREHPDLISETRGLLLASGRPFVIENVPGAASELINPVVLCGTMFGLQSASGNQLHRHRLFELSYGFLLVSPCSHNRLSAIGVYGGGQNPARRKRVSVFAALDVDFGIGARQQAMGINWMPGMELNQAIPPSYTAYIGAHLIAHLEAA